MLNTLATSHRTGNKVYSYEGSKGPQKPRSHWGWLLPPTVVSNIFFSQALCLQESPQLEILELFPSLLEGLIKLGPKQNLDVVLSVTVIFLSDSVGPHPVAPPHSSDICSNKRQSGTGFFYSAVSSAGSSWKQTRTKCIASYASDSAHMSQWAHQDLQNQWEMDPNLCSIPEMLQDLPEVTKLPRASVYPSVSYNQIVWIVVLLIFLTDICDFVFPGYVSQVLL